jgi:sucrose phosphorylase
MTFETHIRKQLDFLYGSQGDRIWLEIKQIMEDFQARNPQLSEVEFQLDEKDVVLITYGDQFLEKDRPHLESLSRFLEHNLSECINRVHILPFYPYSSDDGFSVMDFRQVNPEIGSWEDINRMGNKFELMFDAVVNHISRQSAWFKAFLRAEFPFDEYFITIDPDTDLTSVFRPRDLPLLTAVETNAGEKHVWTTFSDDQIDLNYSHPQLFLEIISLLLFYIEQGARLIRLDAIGYVWKQIGTSSLNLPQAHSIVKILRSVLNLVAPQVGLITETNVPHEENIRYFGDPVEKPEPGEKPLRGDEAQLIYQFSLAPLVLHTFDCGDVSVLKNWARTLSVPYADSSFFNFIASHDGIGVMPAKGLLTEDEINTLVDRTLSHGGEVSYKTNTDGSKSVYELNITLFDALNKPKKTNPEADVKRFLASQAIMLSLAGVPGIYIHSLFGSRNCHSCVEETDRARSINREKFNLDELQSQLSNPGNLHTKVFQGYKHLLNLRRIHPAFHPNGSQQVLEANQRVFSVLRSDPRQKEHIICLVNVSPGKQEVNIDLESIGLADVSMFKDIIENKTISVIARNLNLVIDGYQTMWLVVCD